jgi:hypothetical protein
MPLVCNACRVLAKVSYHPRCEEHSRIDVPALGKTLPDSYFARHREAEARTVQRCNGRGNVLHEDQRIGNDVGSRNSHNHALLFTIWRRRDGN